MSFCPTCGRPRAGDGRFCDRCGHDFQELAADGETPPPAEPAESATGGPRWDQPMDATRWDAPIDATRLERMPPPAARPAASASSATAESGEPAGQAGPAEPDPFAAWFAPEAPAAPLGQPVPPRTAPPDRWQAADTLYGTPPPAGSYRPPAGSYPPPAGAYPPPGPPGPGFQPPGPAYGGGPGRRSSRGGKAALIIVAVLIVLAAGGAAYKLVSRSGKSAALASPSAGAPSAASSGQARTGASGTPAASPSASGPASTPSASASLVSIASSVGSNPAAPQVETVLSHFFQGINTHSYPEYTSALDAPERARQSPSAFSKGYSTTTDSAMTLTSLTSTGGGGLAATVTFTSHQAASSSVDNSTCNLWTLTFYLVPQGTGYLDGFAPSGYQPKYSNC